MTNDRSSEADEPILVQDAQEIARIEAENTLRQFDAAMKELQKWIVSENYKLKFPVILRFNRVALNGLSKYAGVFRPGNIKITGSNHQPAEAERVPELIDEFCEYIAENWHDKSPIHLAAYALWKLNWIHPFVDGNGRTSRIVSYLIICAKLGYRLPGSKTIPDQIAENKKPYYQALESADRAFAEGDVDVSALESLIDAHLATQLLGIHDMAAGNSGSRSAVAELADADVAPTDGKNMQVGIVDKFVRHIESHPVIYTGLFTIAAALLAIVLT